jgi:microcystin degradation protein MlrC
MRVFTASLATETNTFSPVPTDMASFRGAFYAPPGMHPETPTLCSAPIVVLRRRAKAEGFALIEGTATWAEPGGLLQKAAYETLRDQVLAELEAAMPVDCVVLGLHGAMVAQSYDDCEGDLLARVRAIVGPETIIAAELDPHSHLTPKRVAAADILAAFLEFPHTDFVERGEHVVDLALRAARGDIAPVISTFDCRMAGIYPTSRQPMRGFVDALRELEGKDGILSISVIHGFMAADVAELGTRMLVVSDGKKDAGDRLARELGLRLFALRGTTSMPAAGIDATLDRAAGAGTLVLRRMIERGFASVAVSTIWDPMAVTFCHAAGEGAVIPLRFGGKCGPAAGEPIDATVTVVKAVAKAWQGFGRSEVPLGPAAVVRLAGTEIDVILNTNRAQTFEPNLLSNLGIDPAAKAVLLVKSTNHFHAGFAPIAAEILYVDAGGPYPSDPRTIPYTKLTRPIWPRVEDPFAGSPA